MFFFENVFFLVRFLEFFLSVCFLFRFGVPSVSVSFILRGQDRCIFSSYAAMYSQRGHQKKETVLISGGLYSNSSYKKRGVYFVPPLKITNQWQQSTLQMIRRNEPGTTTVATRQQHLYILNQKINNRIAIPETSGKL